MSRVAYYRWSLLVPPVVLGLGLLLPQTEPFLWFAGVAWWGLGLGGLPYACLATWLFVQSKRLPAGRLERRLLLAPLLLLPLVVAWTVIASLILGAFGAAPLAERFVGGLQISLFACIYTVFVGYFFVAAVFGSRRALQHYGVVENA